MAVYKRVDEDYKKLFDEQAKATKILAKRCREKELEIMRLNKEINHLKTLLKKEKKVG